MDDLVNQVASKVGIPIPQARMAVDTVLDFLYTRLPAPVANQIRGLFSGTVPSASSLKQAGDVLGGLLKKK